MTWRGALLPVAAICISIFSLIQSCQSTELAKEAMWLNEWPWFAINDMAIEPRDENSFRIVGALKHYSGGPAINVRFSINVRGKSSELHTDTPALMPGDDVKIKSPAVNLPTLKLGDEVEWHFTYNDVSGRCYESLQVLMFRADGEIKSVNYENKRTDCQP